ncbi:LacI family transcriptional regulator [Paenibacillus psychroresistens]|uniref:LacI family transcriptional regulator n=1 Tax=Paenibacillus psychroresistens TaxID=1778678 RepID=A0A6B8RL97_9BACL|nr:LacI family DNA-binding transcriptional regulator [Paenibacillus psychroresistens]QGQ97161.1 LacI family transcriptional regulator [Paenibacillus psychroresistens]
MKRITIKDVARVAGVSTAAISYALNGKESKVSTGTLMKIQEAVALLNYIPDFSARSLVNKKSYLIGVVIPETEEHNQMILENPFYSEIVSAIESELRKHNYHLILTGTDKGKGYFDLSMQRNLDGAIIMGIYHESFYEELKKVNIPIILIDSYINDTYFKKIGIDDRCGGGLATRHLIENGHTQIAIVTGEIKRNGVVEERFLGYQDALAEANLSYSLEYVFEESTSYEHGVLAGKRIASNHPEITGVFATADIVAFGIISGLNECGKRVPDDISVIGFDDITMSRMFIPPLTTIHQDIKAKGIQAVNCLIQAIQCIASNDHEKITLPLSLMERQSVKKI